MCLCAERPNNPFRSSGLAASEWVIGLFLRSCEMGLGHFGFEGDFFLHWVLFFYWGFVGGLLYGGLICVERGVVLHGGRNEKMIEWNYSGI